MELKPGLKYSIDRIYNYGPYGPWNCRWTTKLEQNRNRRVEPNINKGNFC